MMKTLSPKLLLTLSGLLSAAAFAAEDINETMDAAADGTVSISNVAGEVEVQGWSRKQVEITGELGSDVDELIFERDGNEILIKVKVPRNHGRRIASELIVKVPESSSLESKRYRRQLGQRRRGYCGRQEANAFQAQFS